MDWPGYTRQVRTTQAAQGGYREAMGGGEGKVDWSLWEGGLGPGGPYSGVSPTPILARTGGRPVSGP